MSRDDSLRQIATAGDVYAEFSVDHYPAADDTPAVVVPGWFADDGNAEVYFPDAKDGAAAAREYVDGGAWGESAKEVHVATWRLALIGQDGDVAKVRLSEETHDVEIRR